MKTNTINIKDLGIYFKLVELQREISLNLIQIKEQQEQIIKKINRTKKLGIAFKSFEYRANNGIKLLTDDEKKELNRLLKIRHINIDLNKGVLK